MAQLTMLEKWWPGEVEFGLRKSVVRGSSPYNMKTMVQPQAGHRWVASMLIPGRHLADVPGLESWFLKLCGGEHTVLLPHLGRRVWAPKGTLRGSPLLSATAARGADSITITAYEAANLCATSGFENDTDNDGLANNWTLYTAGTTSGVTAARESDVPYAGAWSQFISADALGTGSGDRIGIWQRIDLGGDKSGQPLTVSAQLRGDKPSKVRVYAICRDAGLTQLSTITDIASTNSRYKWQKVEATGTLPTGTTTVDLYIWMEQGDGGSSWIGIDTARCALGNPTPDTTLLADDLISVGGQLLMVAADTVGGGDGTMVVPLVNRVRSTISAGAGVVWNRPTVEMMCLQSPRIGFRNGGRDVAMNVLSLELEEYVP
jgi:hypothetical protein